MICRNCGNEAEDNVLFCPFCGKKIDEMKDSEKKSAAVSDVFGDSPVQTETTVPAYEPKPPVTPVPAFEPKPPVTPVPAFEPKPPVTPVPAFEPKPQAIPPVQPAQIPPVQKQTEGTAPKKEKEFFGVGAFVLCLVVIGILAASTGVFASLYFSLLGAV